MTGPCRRFNDYLSLLALAITSEEHNDQLNEWQTHCTAGTLLPSTDLTTVPSRRCVPVTETATTVFPQIQNSLFFTEFRMHVMQDAILHNYVAGSGQAPTHRNLKIKHLSMLYKWAAITQSV